MLFNSVDFLIFFPAVVAIYFAIPYKYRWVFLLASSYYFYMCWKASYIILIIISTLIDYVAGIRMGKTKDKKRRKKYLILSLCSNLGILFAFKYFNFAADSIETAFQQFNILANMPEFKLLLPVGISFYTFQTLSYSIDVYRGVKKPEKHLGIFALYVAFFPQLVAGPIERSTRLLPQFFEKKDFKYDRVTKGLQLMLWGFFKKLVIADHVAIFVNHVYNNTGHHNGLAYIIATVFFGFQIYCDFSGYSDIAIGSAKVLGYDLMTNFRSPYFAQSVQEFWQRWHISLSTWFKDYVYIPLGGNKVPVNRWYWNLMTVFVVSGLWHGANWTFFIWGFLHGLYLITGIHFAKFRTALYKFLWLDRTPFFLRVIKGLVTFTLVSFAWIFFRANDLDDALHIIAKIFSDSDNYMKVKFDLSGFDVQFAWFSIALLMAAEYANKKMDVHKWLSEKPLLLRWSAYYVAIIITLIFAVDNAEEFIYFQF